MANSLDSKLVCFPSLCSSIVSTMVDTLLLVHFLVIPDKFKVAVSNYGDFSNFSNFSMYVIQRKVLQHAIARSSTLTI